MRHRPYAASGSSELNSESSYDGPVRSGVEIGHLDGELVLDAHNEVHSVRLENDPVVAADTAAADIDNLAEGSLGQEVHSCILAEPGVQEEVLAAGRGRHRA